MSDHDTILACPQCDFADIYQRKSNITDPLSNRRGNPDHEYYCNRCNTSFDTPTERERHRPITLHGNAKLLEDADPDAWP